MPHIHEKIDFTVDVFIVHDQKVLLIFHKKHNMWLQIGGHIELDEDPDQALLREVKEECGLDIEVMAKKEPQIHVPGTKFLYPPSFMNIHDINENHQHIGLIYFAKAKSDKVALSEREHNDIRWFSLEDLDKAEYNLNGAVKFYAKEALKEALKSNIQQPMEPMPGIVQDQKSMRPKVGIGVLVMKDGKFLLGKRKHSDGLGDAEYAGTGGHMEHMESFEDCAKRETFEETGVKIKNIRFLCLVNVKKYAPKHYVDIGLVADWESGEPTITEPDKIESWGWYDLNDLPQPMFAMIPKYFESYKTGIKYWDN